MAGNIIPAIATTNAIVAGLVVMQALNLLRNKVDDARVVWLRPDPSKPLRPEIPSAPNPKCAVCRDTYVQFKVDTARCTLGEFVQKVVQDWTGDAIKQNITEDDDDAEIEWSILEGGRVLADPDFDDNHGRTLADLGVDRGKMLTLMDEDEKYRPIHFCVCAL